MGRLLACTPMVALVSLVPYSSVTLPKIFVLAASRNFIKGCRLFIHNPGILSAEGKLQQSTSTEAMRVPCLE
uniref:Putative secreted protein n=1 Tax=Ixodes ricinus TaxID=34613 RepID=A0A6B0TU96_IXORI